LQIYIEPHEEQLISNNIASSMLQHHTINKNKVLSDRYREGAK